jgi:RNA polymerase primary sigma factor
MPKETAKPSKSKAAAKPVAKKPAPKKAAPARTRLKNLIALGKERGFLTYAEVNDHLPDDMVDAEQIESIISTFNDMGDPGLRRGARRRDLLMSESRRRPVADEAVEEEAEQALSTVDSEFGRTTDPVRMYMREMGSVELLTREGEIEIAKRIEDGLKHMIQAISACPTTIAEMLELAGKVARDEMRIDELVDGLIDPNAPRTIAALAEAEELEGGRGDRGGRATGGAVRPPCCSSSRRAGALHHIHGCSPRCRPRWPRRARRTRPTSRPKSRSPAELMNIRFTAKAIERLCDSVRTWSRRAQPRAQDPGPVRGQGAHAAPALHQGLPRQRDRSRMAQARGHRRQALRRHADARGAGHAREQQKLIDLQNRIGIRSRTSRTSTSRCPPAKPRRAAPSAK